MGNHPWYWLQTMLHGMLRTPLVAALPVYVFHLPQVLKQPTIAHAALDNFSLTGSAMQGA
jgi:hypothetical protein